MQAFSELLYVSPNTFLALARDGKGNGNGNAPSPSRSALTSDYKNIVLVTTQGATNIAGSAFDTPENPVSADGTTLNPAITAATVTNFVSLIESAELAKAGLQNGPPIATDIVGKIESLALASVLDP